MFIIDKNNKIKLTRGDTATIYVSVFDLDNKEYQIKSTDVITMTVRKNSSSSTIAFTKIADAEHYITIRPEDTSSLTNGTYVYDIQLSTQDGFIYTIVPENFFVLTGEVTR